MSSEPDIIETIGAPPADLTPADVTRPRKVILVRHGQTSFDLEERATGQLDPDLTDLGREQALRLARALRDEPPTAIYASTLRRGVETARPTAQAHGLEIIAAPELCEQHMGVMQGRPRGDHDPETARLRHARRQGGLTFRYPGGESTIDMLERLWPRLEAILRREAGGVVLIVGHRRINPAILALLLDTPLSELSALRVEDEHLVEFSPGVAPVLRTVSLRDADFGRSWEGLRP